MIKPILFFTLSLFLFSEGYAQKKDTSVYYLQNSGKIVSTKDSADFFLLILPPDTSIDKNLFIVKEFYRSGKVAMICKSTTNIVGKLKFEGTQVVFFPNGRRMQITNYLNGQISGDVLNYYPNGKLCTVKIYSPGKRPFLKQYNDSTGIVLAENGNGKWMKFDDVPFKNPYVEGNVVNGIEEGEWRGKENDTIDIVRVYKNGEITSSKDVDKSGAEVQSRSKIFTSVEKMPEFPGGLDQFYKFLGRTLNYPYLAKRNGVQGRVIVAFVVEKDGSLSDIKVIKGIGDGCDEEAVRIIGLSPHWSPAAQNGRPVRVAYSLPITFTLPN
jgi:TonB family protein